VGELRRITERYRLDRRIDNSGSGAAGSVFQGTAIQTGEAVAVKLFDIGDMGDSSEEREIFDAYTHALAALSHPGLPHVVDAGFTSAGSAYLVTSYLQGTPLAEATGAPPARVLSLLLCVTEALEALAETGWAHGNLQLDNVIVVPEPVGEEIKLLGLGTAVFRPGADVFGLSAAVGYPADRRDLAALACQLFGAPLPAEGSSKVRLPPAVGIGIEDVAGLAQVLGDALAGDPAGRLPSYPELRRLLRQSLPDLGLRTAAARVASGTAPGLAGPGPTPNAGGWREVRLGTDTAALAGSGTMAEASIPSETMILERLTESPAPPPPLASTAALPSPPPPGARPAVVEHTRILRMDDITAGDPRLEELLRQRAPKPPAEPRSVLRPELPTAALTPIPTIPTSSTTPVPPPLPTMPTVPVMPVPPREAAARTPPPLGGTVRISREDFEALVQPPPAPAAERPRGKAPRLSAPAPATVPEPPRAPVAPPLSAAAPFEAAVPVTPRPVTPRPIVPPPEIPVAMPTMPMTPKSPLPPMPPMPPMPPIPPIPPIPPAMSTMPVPSVLPPPPPATPIPTAPPVPTAPRSLEETLPAPAAPSPRRPSPPGSTRRWLSLGGAAAALFLLVMALGVVFWSRRPAPPPPKRVVVVPKPPVAPPPVAQPAPAPLPPVHPQIAQAEAQILGGDLAAAKTTLDAIPADQKARFTPDETARYQQALATLAPIAAEQAVGHLTQSLAAGDVKALKVQVAALHPEQEAALPPEVKKDLARARKVLDLDGKLSRAERARDPQETIRQAGFLLAELPRYPRATQSRDRAAADLEADADKKLQDGDLDGALARLGQLHDVWPERRGLGERMDRVQGEKRADQALEEKLAAATRAEKQQKPLEGLAALKGTEPNRRYADRFRQEKERLEAQFAALDRKPPEVAFAKSLKDFKYAKGATITIPLHVTDDYEVKSVQAWARPKDGTYVQVAVNPGSGGDYELVIPPSVHANKEVEFYILATDRSGHEGHLGTPQEPKQIKRKWSLF
jgi:hypothetical protein